RINDAITAYEADRKITQKKNEKVKYAQLMIPKTEQLVALLEENEADQEIIDKYKGEKGKIAYFKGIIEKDKEEKRIAAEEKAAEEKRLADEAARKEKERKAANINTAKTIYESEKKQAKKLKAEVEKAELLKPAATAFVAVLEANDGDKDLITALKNDIEEYDAIIKDDAEAKVAASEKKRKADELAKKEAKKKANNIKLAEAVYKKEVKDSKKKNKVDSAVIMQPAAEAYLKILEANGGDEKLIATLKTDIQNYKDTIQDDADAKAKAAEEKRLVDEAAQKEKERKENNIKTAKAAYEIEEKKADKLDTEVEKADLLKTAAAAYIAVLEANGGDKALITSLKNDITKYDLAIKKDADEKLAAAKKKKEEEERLAEAEAKKIEEEAARKKRINDAVTAYEADRKITQKKNEKVKYAELMIPKTENLIAFLKENKAEQELIDKYEGEDSKVAYFKGIIEKDIEKKRIAAEKKAEQEKKAELAKAKKETEKIKITKEEKSAIKREGVTEALDNGTVVSKAEYDAVKQDLGIAQNKEPEVVEKEVKVPVKLTDQERAAIKKDGVDEALKNGTVVSKADHEAVKADLQTEQSKEPEVIEKTKEVKVPVTLTDTEIAAIKQDGVDEALNNGTVVSKAEHESVKTELETEKKKEPKVIEKTKEVKVPVTLTDTERAAIKQDGVDEALNNGTVVSKADHEAVKADLQTEQNKEPAVVEKVVEKEVIVPAKLTDTVRDAIKLEGVGEALRDGTVVSKADYDALKADLETEQGKKTVVVEKVVEKEVEVPAKLTDAEKAALKKEGVDEALNNGTVVSKADYEAVKADLETEQNKEPQVVEKVVEKEKIVEVPASLTDAEKAAIKKEGVDEALNNGTVVSKTEYDAVKAGLETEKNKAPEVISAAKKREIGEEYLKEKVASGEYVEFSKLQEKLKATITDLKTDIKQPDATIPATEEKIPEKEEVIEEPREDAKEKVIVAPEPKNKVSQEEVAPKKEESLYAIQEKLKKLQAELDHGVNEAVFDLKWMVYFETKLKELILTLKVLQEKKAINDFKYKSYSDPLINIQTKIARKLMIVEKVRKALDIIKDLQEVLKEDPINDDKFRTLLDSLETATN
ncbi:hypothetical protein ACFL5G_05660, partial [Candidatus Margulisiibacteriota bacterium]